MSIGSFSENRASSGMFNIQVSAEDMKAFADLATLVPKAAANAQRRAINKTLGWLSTHIARAVGKQERIAVKAVRQRLRSYPIAGGAMRGKLWFGINPLEASRTGRPRQTKAGVSVGSRRYRGAFYKKVYGNQADIWIRTASKHFARADVAEQTVAAPDVVVADHGHAGEHHAELLGRRALGENGLAPVVVLLHRAETLQQQRQLITANAAKQARVG